MIRFNVITLFPEMIESMMSHGVIGQAFNKKLIELKTVNPRTFSDDNHKSVDDRPYGGGDGMVMMYDPLVASIKSIKETGSLGKVIYLSPQGSLLDFEKSEELAKEEHLTLICGRYGGIDQRIINDFVDEEISIGDYVISGGELAAGVLIDSVSRFVPGVLGHEDSVYADSLAYGLLEAPAFTKPKENQSGTVPEVLLSGHHKNIHEWRNKVGTLVTILKRPDLFFRQEWTQKDIQDLKKFFQSLKDSEKEILGLSSLESTDIDELFIGEDK